MRSLFRGILVTLAAVVVLAAMTAPALANTELVPASRLIAPFFDITSGRATFYLLTNVSSSLHLNCETPGNGFGPFGVHLEHYGQGCNRVNEPDCLTPLDIDQFDLTVNSIVRSNTGAGQALGPVTPSATQSGLAGRGWTDIDTRFGTAVLTSSPSIVANVLLGTVILTDSANDFALAYPMASILASSYNSKIGAIVVTRNEVGGATAWTGRYEPLPRRIFVPLYFAIGTDPAGTVPPGNIGQTFTAFLAIAGPPDGNWNGWNSGEAPGQSTGQAAGFGGQSNLTLNFSIFDGCERNTSANHSSHYLNREYDNLFGTQVNRSFPWAPAPTSCPALAFPTRDELSGQAVGWIDIANVALACSNRFTTSECPADQFSDEGRGTGEQRGMAGISFQTVSGTNIIKTLGDVTRLWGDPSPWGIPPAPGSGGVGPSYVSGVDCPAGVPCIYSFVNNVRWEAIRQGGILNTTNSCVPPSVPGVC